MHFFSIKQLSPVACFAAMKDTSYHNVQGCQTTLSSYGTLFGATSTTGTKMGWKGNRQLYCNDVKWRPRGICCSNHTIMNQIRNLSKKSQGPSCVSEDTFKQATSATNKSTTRRSCEIWTKYQLFRCFDCLLVLLICVTLRETTAFFFNQCIFGLSQYLQSSKRKITRYSKLCPMTNRNTSPHRNSSQHNWGLFLCTKTSRHMSRHFILH